TNNDSAYATAFDLAASGVAVAIADMRATVDPALAGRAQSIGVELLPGSSVLDVLGGKAVSGALVGPASGPARRIDCDLVCMSGGWSPAVHLTSHGGIKPRYRDDI